MIIHVTTATSNAGKLGQMADWAQRITAMVKENHGKEITVLRNVGGSNYEWHFMSTHDSLADLEAYTNAVLADPQFHAMAAEAMEKELWSTATRDNLFRSAF